MDSLSKRPTSREPLIRALVAFFIVALTLSGLSAIPIPWGARLLEAGFGPGTWPARLWPALGEWIGTIAMGIEATTTSYPFMFYGTDWLAFGHIVIAIAFLGPLRDPVRNVWVIEFGIIACALVIPWALAFGALRGIPFFWQIIDCSFGIGGLVVLLPTYWLIRTEIARAQ
jgi:hypothetical protein